MVVGIIHFHSADIKGQIPNLDLKFHLQRESLTAATGRCPNLAEQSRDDVTFSTPGANSLR